MKYVDFVNTVRGESIAETDAAQVSFICKKSEVDFYQKLLAIEVWEIKPEATVKGMVASFHGQGKLTQGITFSE